MSIALPACPNCQSKDVVKNGKTRHGKQNYKCRDCGRQFVEAPQWRTISEETKGIVDRLLLEKLPLAGIARALQISEVWVQQYVNQKYNQLGREVIVRPKQIRRLRVQMDELWSFVNDKGNQQWVWLAMDVVTREKQLVATSATVVVNRLRHCGTLYPPCIASVPFAIVISGFLILWRYRVNDIAQSVRKRV